MKIPKINWLTVASGIITICGLIISEVQREKDMQEAKDELKEYVDNQMQEKEPDSE